ncbi:MAG: T9SS type A sorting domain-containing protein, partial [Bacteroidota bacterium]
TDGIIRISSEKALLKGVTILDLLGRNVFESILNPSSDIELDVQTLSKGLYVMEITDNHNEITTVKISIE